MSIIYLRYITLYHLQYYSYPDNIKGQKSTLEKAENTQPYYTLQVAILTLLLTSYFEQVTPPLSDVCGLSFLSHVWL